MPASNAQSKPPSPDTGAATQWRDAQLAAALIAVLGHRGGGIRVCAQPGPVRDYWLSNLDGLLTQPARRVPGTTPTERLLGGMDVTESMKHGKPVLAMGVLAECHNRFVILPMAERLPKEFSGHWCGALDRGQVIILSNTTMEMVAYQQETDLVIGRFGIRTSKENKVTELRALDWLIMPCCGFDRRGYRVFTSSFSSSCSCSLITKKNLKKVNREF